MGVMDVVEEQTDEAAEQASETAESTDASLDALGANRPSLAISTANGEFVLDAVTLALYGIVLADALLVYIALRV